MHLAAAFLGFLFSGDVPSSTPTNSGNQFRRDSTASRIWEYGADFKFNFSLANSSPNWNSGSSNNISFAGLISAGANLKKERMSWDNTLKINVGVIANRQSDIFGDGFWSTRKTVSYTHLTLPTILRV